MSQRTETPFATVEEALENVRRGRMVVVCDGEDRENDLIGVYVIAAVLVLLSLTTEEANIAAAVGGALTGSVIGLLLPRLTRTA